MTMLAIEPQPANERWARIAAHAPVLVATARDYVNQIAVSARPNTVEAADRALRIFADWLIDHDPDVVALRQLNRRHIERYKLFMNTRENHRGQPLKKSTINLRLGTLRVIIEPPPSSWPPQPPEVFSTTKPAWIRSGGSWVEMLARTGLRVGEFCRLTADAIITIGDTNWLRVPVGKLHTDRYVPLHPILIELHRTWRAWAGPDDAGLLITNHDRPLNRDSVSRAVRRCARIAGIGHVHPHQLRHTLATQAFLGWYRDDVDVQALLPRLSTYLGHVAPSSTYWYLSAAPELMAVAAERLDRHREGTR